MTTRESMSCRVDNAIVMAAGTSSRFAPLSYEGPKALLEVRGEVLIERQIRQLLDAGVPEVIVVSGYMGERLAYLQKKFGVRMVVNREYLTRNNNGSIYAVRKFLRNSYICSSDNYFTQNPFESQVDGAYYAAAYADGPTAEWCMQADGDGYISDVRVGGADAWYMLGHAFWDESFSRQFCRILEDIYPLEESRALYWEDVLARNLDRLKMKIRRYPPDVIYEFDTLDELRAFDASYLDDARSPILRSVAERLGCRQRDLRDLRALRDGSAAAVGFSFQAGDRRYRYSYETEEIEEV